MIAALLGPTSLSQTFLKYSKPNKSNMFRLAGSSSHDQYTHTHNPTELNTAQHSNSLNQKQIDKRLPNASSVSWLYSVPCPNPICFAASSCAAASPIP